MIVLLSYITYTSHTKHVRLMQIKSELNISAQTSNPSIRPSPDDWLVTLLFSNPARLHTLTACVHVWHVLYVFAMVSTPYGWRLPCLLGLCCRGSVPLCKLCLPDEKEAGTAMMFRSPDCVKLAPGTSEGLLLYLAFILTISFSPIIFHIYETED